MARSAFHEHLARKGPLTRQNPEVVRLATATGYSADHVYQVAIGQRVPPAKCAIALARALKGKADDAAAELLQVVRQP